MDCWGWGQVPCLGNTCEMPIYAFYWHQCHSNISCCCMSLVQVVLHAARGWGHVSYLVNTLEVSCKPSLGGPLLHIFQLDVLTMDLRLEQQPFRASSLARQHFCQRLMCFGVWPSCWGCRPLDGDCCCLFICNGDTTWMTSVGIVSLLLTLETVGIKWSVAPLSRSSQYNRFSAVIDSLNLHKINGM